MLRVFALFSFALFSVLPASAADKGMIHLFGTPEQIGTIWGTVNRDLIQKDVDLHYLKPAEKAGISRDELISRSAEYVRIVNEIAPHWITEAKAIAKAAGVDEQVYLAFIDGQVRNRFLHECTSYAVPRHQTRDGLILFHKNRDNDDRPQVAPIVDSSIEGVYKFITVSDACRIDCSMMVNEKGLAGAADYPADRKKDSSKLALPPAEPRYRGMMCGAILRHIAERASNCAEALEIIEDFVAKGYYAGGDVNGTHWLFVDREGTILEVSNNSAHVASATHSQSLYFSRLTNSPAAQKLRSSQEPIDFHTFRNASRDRSICFGSSISGMTVEIDPVHPDMFTCAWIALPARSVAFPLMMGQSQTPTCLIDGTFNDLGKKSSQQVEAWEAIELAMRKEKEQLKQDLIASIEAGNPAPVHIESIEQWSSAQAERLINALQKSK